MDQPPIALSEIATRLSAVADRLIKYATDPWVAIQITLLAGILAIAIVAAHRLRPRLAAWGQNEKIGPRGARVIAALQVVLLPLILVGLLWPAIGVVTQMEPEADVRLVGIAATLLTAWVAIRLGVTLIRNSIIAAIIAPIAWTIAALSIVGLLQPTIQFLDSASITLGNFRLSVLVALKGIAVMAALLWASLVLAHFLEQRLRGASELTPSAQVLLGKFLRITLIAAALVVALNSIGIDLTALALLSGGVGLGLGFGLQKVVSNLISGFILLLDKSIKPGDVIEVGETFGWITSLRARYVSVVTRDGKEYLIPNEDLITQRVVNWSFSSQLVRLEVTFGVAYSADPHLVRRLACEAAAKPSRVVREPKPVCHLTAFGESSLDFILRFWIRDPEDGVLNVKGQVLLALWDILRENNIEIPYPHRQIILQQPISVAAGDGRPLPSGPPSADAPG
jgi:small-conductance mechanosensitive channel